MKPIPLCEPQLGAREKEWLARCVDSGFVSSVGPMIGEFEKQFAAFVGARYAVATASGTTALHVALHALGVGQGDLVGVSDLTFIASANPVLYCGARPLLLDVQADTWCLDTNLLAGLCARLRDRGTRLRAVIPVHLYGVACDLGHLRALADEFDFWLVEDATEALGTFYQGRHTGTFGEVGCFSFNGNKMITTGSGGMAVTNSEELARRMRYLVNQARDSSANYIHSEMGFNYRMSNLAAALGLAQMERLPIHLAAKREFARRYRAGLAGCPGIQLHPEPEGVDGSYWLYSLVLENPTLRDHVLGILRGAQIAARPFFDPLHRQPYIKESLWVHGPQGPRMADHGASDQLADCGLNLPSSPQMTIEEQAMVIQALREALPATAHPPAAPGHPCTRHGPVT